MRKDRAAPCMNTHESERARILCSATIHNVDAMRVGGERHRQRLFSPSADNEKLKKLGHINLAARLIIC